MVLPSEAPLGRQDADGVPEGRASVSLTEQENGGLGEVGS